MSRPHDDSALAKTALADTELQSSDPRSSDSDTGFGELLRKVAKITSGASLPHHHGIHIGGQLCGGRFSIHRQLGEGGMGVVFEAYDHVQGEPVALKTLSTLHAASIYQLKGEFRVLADLTHENLVGLRELFEDNGRWFFTMDLVRGQPLTAFLRTHPGEASLRASFRQLAEGIAAIHRAGRLHRDLKPSNVLVNEVGHVTILDFGLATWRATPAAGETLGNVISGTPAYMAPEQVVGEVYEASDLYALGVMLFETLSGRLPFEGSAADVLRAKQAATDTAQFVLPPETAPDLANLCRALLQPAPEARPEISDVLSRLGAAPIKRSSLPSPGPSSAFVGRHAELLILERALAATDRHQVAAVMIFGRSGMGKSALAQRFLAQVDRRHDTVTLRGRCYERESVPFKGFDALIDGLGRYLRSIPNDEAASLMPSGIHALCRVFPTLARVQAVAAVPTRRALPPEPRQIRELAFAALRDLLTRLAERSVVVLQVDDLQWADFDSAQLLTHLLAPPNAPALLFLATCRSEDRATSPFFEAFFAGAARAGIDVQELELHPLSETEAAEVATSLLRDEQRAHRAAREAAGHPFLLEELCRFLQESETSDPGISLSTALRFRFERLRPSLRSFCEAVAVAGRPTARSVIMRACGLSQDGQAASMVAQLTSERLLRTQVVDSIERLECYHDRTREALVASMEKDAVARTHAALADAMLAEEVADPEAIASHLLAAGRAVEAARYAEQAGHAARSALAFERAAHWFRMAVSHAAEAPPTKRAELTQALAEALAHAGRGADAAHAFLEAATHTGDPAAAIHLRTQAANQFVVTGHFNESDQLLTAILEEVGLDAPKADVTVLLAFARERALLKLKSLTFTPRTDPLPTEERLRLEACKAASHCYATWDFVRGAVYSSRQLRLALGAREPAHALHSIANEVIIVAADGPKAEARVRTLADRGKSLATEVGSPAGSAFLEGALAAGEVMLGRFAAGLPQFESAEKELREHCTGVTWELNVVRSFWAIALVATGQLPKATRLLLEWVEDARARSDRYAFCHLQLNLPVPLLARDDTESAQGAVDEALAHWTSRGFDQPMLNACDTRTSIELYRGADPEALRAQLEGYARFFRSLLATAHANRMFSHYFSGCCELGLLELGKGESGMLRRVRWRAGKLRSGGGAVAEGYAELLDACASAYAKQDDACRRHLEAAGTVFDVQQLGCVAAGVQLRLGHLIDGDQGRELRGLAERRFADMGVANPERFTRMLTPGFG